MFLTTLMTSKDKTFWEVYNWKLMKNQSDVVHLEPTVYGSMSAPCKDQIGQQVHETLESLDQLVPTVGLVTQ